MRCEQYWREGVLLLEQGLPDPHRETCLDCRREHEARQELLHAFTLIGTNEPGDPHWQSRVWRQISREVPAPAAWRRWGWAGGALAAACVLAMVVVPRRHAGAPVDLRPRIETIASPVAKRSLSASAGDRVRISVLPMQEVRIYRGEQRLLRCAADVAPQPGCVRDDGGLVAELELERPGEYKLLIVLDGAAPLEDTFDRDVAALRTAGSAYQVQPFPVR